MCELHRPLATSPRGVVRGLRRARGGRQEALSPALAAARAGIASFGLQALARRDSAGRLCPAFPGPDPPPRLSGRGPFLALLICGGYRTRVTLQTEPTCPTAPHFFLHWSAPLPSRSRSRPESEGRTSPTRPGPAARPSRIPPLSSAAALARSSGWPSI